VIGKLKVLFLVVAAGCLISTVYAQSNEWSWTGGGEQVNRSITFGVLGTPSLSNDPGSREFPATWTDARGNFWLFGGYATVRDTSAPGGLVLGYFSDMWEFNASTTQWTWVAGPNRPASSGVYGSLGTPAAANYPGQRGGSSTWKDSNGNFWLFGGEGADSTGHSGYLNDLWEFNPTTLQWTWMGGMNQLPTCPSTNSCGPPGVYGNLGTASASNVPGGRSDALSWTDANGNFWLFGGNIYTVYLNGWGGYENDLWMFNPKTNQWAWMGGSSSLPSSCTLNNSCGQPGVYGQQQVASSANIPGAREDSITWTDQAGNLWLFGGFGYDSQDVRGDLNDLWEFNPSTNEWKWVTGSDAVGTTYDGPPGVYGLWQIPAAGNSPGGREQGVGWTDSSGNLWLFGGYGFGSSNASGAFSAGHLNDLWEFNPATNQWTWISGSSSVNQSGSYGTLGDSSPLSTPGSRIGAASWTDKSGNFWLYGGYGYDNSGNFDALGDLWTFKPYASGLPVAAVPFISPPSGTYAAVQSVTITDSTAGASIYYRIGSIGPPTLYSGPITVFTSETIQALASATGYADSPSTSAEYTLNLPPPPAPTFNPPAGTYYGGQSVSISDTEAYSTIYYTTDGSTPTASSSAYSQAVAIPSTETLKAIAVVSGGAASPVTSATYTILPVPPNTWTFVRGDPFNSNDAGVYGILGTPLAFNQPGGRVGAVTWSDTNGNFWLFGGYGADANGNLGYLNDLWEYQPGPQIQDGEWVWMGGSNQLPCSTNSGVTSCGGPSGVYGTLGQSVATNVPGGREGEVSWTDASGNFWIFGGLGIDGTGYFAPLNDLWRYSPASGQWTWMGGSSQASFYGQAGVYGTLNVPGSGNIPGGRYGAVGWVDRAGNLWLFGGYGNDSNDHTWPLNDLWEFSPSSNQWTWKGGTSTLNCIVLGDGSLQCDPVAGVYGQMGTPAGANVPGSRYGALGWTDKGGSFWLFSGSGYDSTGTGGNPNDLWMYQPSTGQWTWESGSNTVPCGFDLQYTEVLCTNSPAVRGTLGIPSAANTPPGSSGAATWVDQQGNLWLFGSNTSLDVTGTYQGRSSDLWTYFPSVNQWAWMGGDFATSNCAWVDVGTLPGSPTYACQGSEGVSGGQDQSALGLEPASRSGAAAWADMQGNFWLFGGETTVPIKVAAGAVENSFTSMNDLWKFQPLASTLPAAATPIFSLTGGSYISGGPLVISNGMATASIYYTTDGTYPTTNSTLYTAPIYISSSETVSAIAVAPGYINSGIASATYLFVPQPATPVISPPSGTYDSVQTVSMSESAPYASIAYTTDGSSPGSLTSQTYTGPIAVSSSETINAMGFVYGDIVTGGIASIDLNHLYSSVASATYTLNLPQAATPAFSVPAGTYSSAQTVTLSDATAGNVIYYTVDGTTPTTASTKYIGPINVSASETIQAIAVAYGYSASTIASAAYTVNLPPPNFTFSSNPGSLTVNAGSQGSVTLTVTPQNGFQSGISFACSGQPASVTCTFNPATLTASGSALTTQLTFAVSATASVEPRRSPLLPATALALAGCALGLRNRRKLKSWLLWVLFGICASAFSACGGGGGNGGVGTGNPQPATYQVKVTATSDSLQQSTTISLTVN
jgi:N-acetylneuraminic acid mutarotase